MSENKETKQEVNKLMVDDYDIIVTGRSEKPYYQIRYHEVGSEPDKYDIGFGSYILGNVFEWRDEYFEVVPEDETKREVTNEQIMYHLKEMEVAQGCLANGINTLFSVMSERKEQLRLSRDEAETIKHGNIALACLTDRMFDISGMNERGKAYVVGKEDVKGFLDFLEEILS